MCPLRLHGSRRRLIVGLGRRTPPYLPQASPRRRACGRAASRARWSPSFPRTPPSIGQRLPRLAAQRCPGAETGPARDALQLRDRAQTFTPHRTAIVFPGRSVAGVHEGQPPSRSSRPAPGGADVDATRFTTLPEAAPRLAMSDTSHRLVAGLLGRELTPAHALRGSMGSDPVMVDADAARFGCRGLSGERRSRRERQFAYRGRLHCRSDTKSRGAGLFGPTHRRCIRRGGAGQTTVPNSPDDRRVS
jgi:hypothetical protein